MIIQQRFQAARDNFTRLCEDGAVQQAVERAAEWMVAAIQGGKKILLCGNGGSAADSQHMAAEFTCRFYRDRRPLPALALTTDTSALTAIGNDYAYEEVFSRQVEAFGMQGDILIGITTSGRSKNVLRACEVARRKGLKTIFLTGGHPISDPELFSLVIAVPSQDTPRIQEMHLLVEHTLSEIVENAVVAAG